ncbi:hypothetical protein N9164_06020 [Draconibacterium sp.]|nr:hypothetical protein [Draconibacterium sp.]
MKKITLLAAILFTSTILFAQSVELTPLYGYTISGKVTGYYGTYDVKDNPMFGGMLSVEIDRGSYVELSYVRTNTDLVITKRDLDINKVGLGVEHYQVGMLREFKEGKVAPFGKVMLGTTRYVQTSEGDRRYWLFSLGVGLGAKIMFSERIGLRLHSNLMLPMEFAGGGLFCGIGTGGAGCSTGVSFNVPTVHWDLGGGLIIKLPDL